MAMCLQFHTKPSVSWWGAAEREKGGKLKALPSTSGGAQGEWDTPPQTLADTSSGVRGGRAGEGSRKAARKGSGGRRRWEKASLAG